MKEEMKRKRDLLQRNNIMRNDYNLILAEINRDRNRNSQRNNNIINERQRQIF